MPLSLGPNFPGSPVAVTYTERPLCLGYLVVSVRESGA